MRNTGKTSWKRNELIEGADDPKREWIKQSNTQTQEDWKIFHKQGTERNIKVTTLKCVSLKYFCSRMLFLACIFFVVFFLPCMCGGQKFSLIFFSSSASSKDKWASNVVVVIVTKNHQRSKVESCIERKKIHMATNAVTFDMSQAIKLMILFHADIFYFITINSNCIRPKWGV